MVRFGTIGGIVLAFALTEALGTDPPPPRGAASRPATSAKVWERLWGALASADWSDSERAVAALAERGDEAAAFLGGRLAPPPADAASVMGLVRQLDATRYAARQKAFERLLAMGRPAVPPLRDALKREGLSAEARGRVEQVIQHWTASPAADSVEGRRLDGARHALARIDTPRSRRLLARLAPKGWVPWGRPVEGVQVRLRAAKAAWAVGEEPLLLADVRNRGKHNLHMWIDQSNEWEVGCDGRWYETNFETTSFALPLPPGGHQHGVRIALEPVWRRRLREGRLGARLNLKPGKHRIRAAVRAGFGGDAYVPPVRAVSDAMEITIVPAAPARPATKSSTPK